MERYQNNLQDQFGNAIPSVTVTVRRVSDGGIASLFSDDGVTPKSNPFTNDLDGEFFFYAANSRYNIFFTGPITDQKDDVLLLDISGSGTNLNVLTDIVTATPPTTELVTGAFQILDADETDTLMQLGYAGSNTLFLRNLMEGGVLQLRAEKAATAGTVNLLAGDPDGSTDLYHNGVFPGLKFSTEHDGINVHSQGNADNEERYINFAHLDGTMRGRIGHISGSTIMGIRNEINGGGFNITSRDGGGVLRTEMFGGAGLGWDHYYNDAKRFSTEADGEVRIYGNSGADGEVRRIIFSYQFTDTDRGVVGHEADDVFYIRQMIHGAPVTVTAEDAGGTTRTILTADPDSTTELRADTDLTLSVAAGENALVASANGAVVLYYDNVSTLQTRQHDGTTALTGAQVKHRDGNFYDVGLAKLPINTISAAEDIDENNQQFYTRKTSGGAVTLELQNDSNIQTGTGWQIANMDTEDITIDATTNTCTLNFMDGGGVTPPTGDRTLAEAGVCTIIKVGVAEYDIWGNAGLS